MHELGRLFNSKIQLWWKTPIIPADNILFDSVCSDITIFVFVKISVILVGQYFSSFLRELKKKVWLFVMCQNPQLSTEARAEWSWVKGTSSFGGD